MSNDELQTVHANRWLVECNNAGLRTGDRILRLISVQLYVEAMEWIRTLKKNVSEENRETKRLL